MQFRFLCCPSQAIGGFLNILGSVMLEFCQKRTKSFFCNVGAVSTVEVQVPPAESVCPVEVQVPPAESVCSVEVQVLPADGRRGLSPHTTVFLPIPQSTIVQEK